MDRRSTDTIPDTSECPQSRRTQILIHVHTSHTRTLWHPCTGSSEVKATLLSVWAGQWEGASVMIEAQEAATKGAHVAVPEGLVPAMIMTMVMAEVYCSPPCRDTTLSALCAFTLESSHYSYNPSHYHSQSIYEETEA